MNVGHPWFLQRQTGVLHHLLVVVLVLKDLGQPDIVHGGTLVGEVAVQVVDALIKSLLGQVEQTGTAHHRGIGTTGSIEAILLVVLQGILTLLFHDGQPLFAAHLPIEIEGLVAPSFIEQGFIHMARQLFQAVGDCHKLLHTVLAVEPVHILTCRLYLISLALCHRCQRQQQSQ